MKRLLGPEPLRILEVGCGPGFMSIIAARLGHDVKAIDGSSGMVEKARRNMRQYHQQVEICEEDGVTLPLEQEQSYDVILPEMRCGHYMIRKKLSDAGRLY